MEYPDNVRNQDRVIPFIRRGRLLIQATRLKRFSDGRLFSLEFNYTGIIM